jgi:pimeloyl-ACP methyl ester carboxylesterase
MTGAGAPLVLLHTIRTQLDVFQKTIPELSRHFQVYALDYPGHGYSDIPEAEYTPEFFTDTVEGFLDALDIKEAIVAGESIGGTIALQLAARHNPRVKRVIAVNAYDYAKGRGVMRSSLAAKAVFGLSNAPVLGATVWRLRMYWVFRSVMRGGVHNPDAIPRELMKEMDAVGNRPRHYKALMSLIRHFPEWEAARKEYGRIKVPVGLIYGQYDWSRPEEREANLSAIPRAQLTTVRGGGHFLSLDAPAEITRLILDAARTETGSERVSSVAVSHQSV